MPITLNGSTGITSPALASDSLTVSSNPVRGIFCSTVILVGTANTTTAGWQKVPIDTADGDTAGWWDNTNKRFRPTMPGFFNFGGRIRTTATGPAALAVAKNGSLIRAVGSDTNGGVLAIGGQAYAYCNGTTDYLELFVFSTLVRTYNTGGLDTYMQIAEPFGQ